eukprot:9475847-Pyramimonas_sp.AAC.1
MVSQEPPAKVARPYASDARALVRISHEDLDKSAYRTYQGMFDVKTPLDSMPHELVMTSLLHRRVPAHGVG